MPALFFDASTGLELPVQGGVVTQGYGPANTDPSVRHLYRKGYHTGIDIAGVPEGTAVLTPRGGTVINTAEFEGKGICVIVETVEGAKLLFGHLSRSSVSVGQTVARGEEVGGIGTTGVSTGVHLHFEVRVADDDVDPGPFLAPMADNGQAPAIPHIVAKVKEDLNLRMGPSKNDPIIQTVPAGRLVQVGRAGWVPVTFEGREGWMWSEFLDAR
ncbi:MAG: M23 family metallopeptidase [Dehalococcoidia bacterium]|nr:M23 family metallopeptidase [Dehalococcoidia bacterium]